MPSKLLGAISPAYGIATGTGPYKHLLGSLGRDHYDKKVNERKEKEEEAKELAKKEMIRRGIESAASHTTTVQKKAGGRIRAIDGKAIKGKTRGRFI